MPRYHVFLSHASADKPAVERLARKLREAGLEPFLDIWCLVGGEPWQEALEEAVHQSGCCAVFFGPVSKGGAWRNQETQLALAHAAQEPSFRVIPVLLPGAKAEDVAGFLSLRTWVDFREGLEDIAALARLVASIRAESPGPGPHSLLDGVHYRCMAPAREPFVQRSEYDKVRDALLDGSGTTTVGITDAAGRLARVRDLIRWWTEEDPPAAVRLLGSGLPNGAGVNLRDLAKRLGEWPLLLKIVNRQLRELIQQDGGQAPQTLQGHSEGVFAVAVLDSRRVVSGSWDGTLRVWMWRAGRPPDP